MEENRQCGVWKNRLPFHTMPSYSFIHRHLLFDVALCENINPTYLSKLQPVQNKAVRITTNSELRASINTCLLKSGIIKVLELYKFEIAKLMHQRHKQNLPVASQKFSYHFPLYTSIQSDQNQKINFIHRNFSLCDVKIFQISWCQNLEFFPI